jgi:hypothetical protein
LSPPARNVEQRASDIGRRVADQPDGRLGDFLSRAWTSHWGGRAQNACAVRLASAGMNIGVDKPRTDGVDPDTLGAEFLGETQGQRVDRALGTGIVDIEVREPRRAAADDIMTIDPPAPPKDFDIRRVASRAVR